MRVLVVNSNRERSPWPVPPIGACAVASAAREAGHEVRLLDLCFSHCPEGDVAKAVADFRPEVIGVSVRNVDNVDWQAPKFYLDEVKRRVFDPLKAVADCPIVIGGPAVGIMPAEVLAFLGVDFAVRGDGEVAFTRLLEVLSDGGSFADVPGLAYRDGDTVKVNEPARAENLDDLPMARPHEWLDLERYRAYNGPLGIQTKRGCALKCTYCVYNRIEGPCYRLKSPGRIVREIEEAVREAGVDYVEFVDSTFNIPLGHALRTLRAVIDARLGVRLNTMGINPGGVTEELFDLLGQAGFSEVSITPETASPAMLESLGKGFTVDDIARAAAIARRSRTPVLWYFLFGAPGETEETVRETLDFVETHVPDHHLVQFVSGIRIFPGAPLERLARDEGQLKAGESLLRPVWYRPPIDRKRLFGLLDEAMLRHPNYIALQDNEFPKSVLRAATAVHRFFHAKRPLWQYLRHIRRLSHALGLPTRTPTRA